MMVFQAVVHSIACTWYTIHLNGWEGYAAKYSDPFFVWGVIATCLGCYILLMALPNVRRAIYDVFLASHIVFVGLFTVACWYHVKLIDDTMNVMHLYAAIGVWSFDRVMRLLRVLYFNIKIGLGTVELRKVKVKALQGQAEVLRVTVDAEKFMFFDKSRRCLPGAYVYVYVPSVYFWQSHPFSVGAWHRESLSRNSGQGSQLVDIPLGLDIGEKKSRDAVYLDFLDDAATMVSRSASSASKASKFSQATRASSMSDVTMVEQDKDTFDLLIRPQQGMTRKLYDMVSQAPGQEKEIYALVEGPYGHFEPILQFDTAIFVTGGVGCTATVPYLQYAVHCAANKIAARRIVFYWIIQHEEQLQWAMQDVLDCMTTHERATRLFKHHRFILEASIYITRTKKPSSCSYDFDMDEKPPKGLSVHYGRRPDLDALVATDVEIAPKSVAMLYCGSSGMSDQARKISARHGIPYFEEAFKW
ncbi:hypothetical protein DM01DRAFT_1340897 [Hesseltinella vesiculosa]|uniref:FAD-binding FR-type domain-containing protein n=1 Tax=Hesseltinella vesiculosa TaxID=101127 RepID=A0A1X2G2Q1_9FUNG|nr:hypothetical protein DM01DRAFT_1340897 [Hesseltinella vesiculosa]